MGVWEILAYNFEFYSSRGGRFRREGGRVTSDLNELDNIIPGGTFDAFADADSQTQAVTNKQYVHIRTQQRNGRKSLTTVQGLDKKFEYSKGT